MRSCKNMLKITDKNNIILEKIPILKRDSFQIL